jgi:hypothetical protein
MGMTRTFNTVDDKATLNPTVHLGDALPLHHLVRFTAGDLANSAHKGLVAVRRVFRGLLIVAAALLAGLSAADAQTRRALTIGIDAYDNLPKLLKATGDARVIQATLERLGFEVDMLLNVDRRRFNRAIADFVLKLQPGDVALVHFSGHGVALDGENYLLPTDVPGPGTGDKDHLKGESIGLTSLIERIGSKVQTQILIIDACRDNPYAAAGTKAFSRRVGLVRVEPPSASGGVFIMYSAGYGQRALDSLSQNDPEPISVYTRVLLRKITVAGKTITDLAREVREDVEKLAKSFGHAQRPAYYDELSGAPFYFVPSRTEPTPGKQEQRAQAPLQPAPVPPPAQPKPINLLAPKNGGQVMIAPHGFWLETIDGNEHPAGRRRQDDSPAGRALERLAGTQRFVAQLFQPGEEAVFAFQDERPATFDTFSVLIPGAGQNLHEFALFVADEAPTGPFRLLGQFATVNAKLMAKQGYQEFTFTAVTAKYLKMQLLSGHAQQDYEQGMLLYEFRLSGSLQ